jgi:ribonuclease HII
MPWIVGIDEAGYGPNLGPLVMTSVACRVPKRLARADLWDALRRAVRRHDDPPDGRVVVGDSKLVYTVARGLPDLELSVLSILPKNGGDPISETLAHLIDRLSPSHHAELRAEPWYTGSSTLPATVDPGECARPGERFQRTCTRRSVDWGHIRSVVICPPRFNALLEKWGSKGALLGDSLSELLGHNRAVVDDGEPVSIVIDKHGGRNTYAAILQHALPDGMVVAREEGMDRSRYSVLGLRQPVSVTFEPRADASHFCVALASMISKYLRELLMREFNAFWLRHLPDLEPTAGYPGDSARYFAAIQPLLAPLGIAEEAIWRRK